MENPCAQCLCSGPIAKEYHSHNDHWLIGRLFVNFIEICVHCVEHYMGLTRFASTVTFHKTPTELSAGSTVKGRTVKESLFLWGIPDQNDMDCYELRKLPQTASELNHTVLAS